MYAPTPATAGLSFSHHQTHVVPNQMPVMPKATVRDAMNAHGESPPVMIRPSRKNRFREGWSCQFRIGLPSFGSSFGLSASGRSIPRGGTGLKDEWGRDADEPRGDGLLLYGRMGDTGEWLSMAVRSNVIAAWFVGVTGEACLDRGMQLVGESAPFELGGLTTGDGFFPPS